MPHTSRRPARASSGPPQAPLGALGPLGLPGHRQAAPHAELDRAPGRRPPRLRRPPAATFAELGLGPPAGPGRSRRGDIHEPVRDPGPGAARRAGRPATCWAAAQTGFGQDAGLRPSAADPAGGRAGPRRREKTPRRAGPRPDQGTRAASRRRPRAAGPCRRGEHRHGLRRRVHQRADSPGCVTPTSWWRRRGRLIDPARAARPARSPASRSPCSTRADHMAGPGFPGPRSTQIIDQDAGRRPSGCSSPPPWTATSASW